MTPLNFEHTQFETVFVPTSAFFGGMPIGQGKCIAVQLSINSYSEALVILPTQERQLYIGDRTRQEWLLLSAQSSVMPPIFCTDLSEVWVRHTTGAGASVALNVLIFQNVPN